MTNYLTRIAQSALGKRPAVMPVVRPLFAAQSTSELLHKRAFPFDRPANPASAEQSAEPMHAVSETDVARSRTHTTNQPANPNAAPQRKSSQNETTPQKPTLRQVMEHLYPPAEVQEAGAKTNTPPIPIVDSRAPSSFYPSPQMQENSQRTAVANEQRYSQGLVDPRSRPSVSHPIFEPRTTGDRNPILRTREEVPPTPPDVHVTIESIELKAASQPATQARPAPPARPAHMSLNEYLERRGSGRQ